MDISTEIIKNALTASAELTRAGFVGVRVIGEVKANYGTAQLIQFTGYPQPTHVDIGHRVQFHKGGFGTVMDCSTHHSPRWLIWTDEGVAGWHGDT